MFSTIAVAETANVATPAVTAVSAGDTVLPQLSFEAQQARAAELSKRADYAYEQEQLRQEQARKLAEAETKVRETVGANSLLLTNATAKVYLDNDFQQMWEDKTATRQFLKEYAAFAASGVSAKSAKALQQILSQPEGLARDMLLTDSFLDYLYYNKNVYQNANSWLYNLGSYNIKAPSAEHIAAWMSAVKKGNSAQFVANLVPKNHIYQETVQRLRIIPSFNNGIFVNIPSYQLFYFRDGNLALQSKVIVGRDDRRTPVMYSKLSNVVVNPPWNVPTTILTKDIVPKLARNPALADSLNYEIFDGAGNKVNPRSVNWSQYINAKSVPYRIRQKAGDDSALGRYKFNMPSSNAIYLHDTPNRGLFGRTDRALSSGCVRIEQADALATILLKEAGWSVDKKGQVLASQKTTSAQIRSDNPVYLYYVTSWVENGTVYSLPDIYKLDTNIPKTAISWEQVKNVI